LLGCRIERCCYLAAQTTVLQGAHLGPGAVLAVGSLAHAGADVPGGTFVPPMTVAVGDPARIVTPDRPEEMAAAIRDVNFAAVAFGVDHEWTDRAARYERMTEVRVTEYASHADDEVIG
jgi:carbonic anhydrase/acetyltransferase-like protein (isoleucine patch superfamily)